MDPNNKPTDQQDPKPDKNLGNDQPRMYSKEEVDDRFRGARKEMDALTAQNQALLTAEKEREQRKLEEQGEFKKIAAGHEAEAKSWKEKFLGLEKKEAKRIEGVVADVEVGIKKLPKDLQDLVSPELSPDAKMRQINKLFEKIDKFTRDVHGGGGGREGPISEDDKAKKMKADMDKKFFGGGE